jgi:hypothetical protein
VASRRHSATFATFYLGDLVAGSLLIGESRQIARLLLQDQCHEDAVWEKSILGENILQKWSPETAKRQARLIRNRLRLLTSEAWEAMANGTSVFVTQFLFAACVKHSRLLGDFLNQVVREHHRTFEERLSDKDFDRFHEFCKDRDPCVSDWKPSTVKKIRQVIFRILAEAKYIDNTKSRRLQPVAIVPEVRQYLVSHGEEYIMRCMETTL